MIDETSGFKAVTHDLEDLSGLDAKTLARRWRTLIGGTLPAGLGRALMLRVLAYQLQAQRYGDLDRASRQALNDVLVRSSKRTMGLDVDTQDRRRMDIVRVPQLRTGTVLSREYGGALHRVMVMEQGVSWNGKTYDSLSKVAFAITGTRWNGPRFFGLRDRTDATGRAKRERPAKTSAAGSKSVQSRAAINSSMSLPKAVVP